MSLQLAKSLLILYTLELLAYCPAIQNQLYNFTKVNMMGSLTLSINDNDLSHTTRLLLYLIHLLLL